MNRILKKAIRQLTQNPGFSTVVVLTLALSIGIATTVFSLFDAVLLRPFPYPNAKQIVRIHTYKQQFGNSASDASIYDFWDWQKRNRSFERLAAYVSVHTNLTGSSEAAQVLRITATSPELFKVLGTRPLLGRTFTRAENEFHGDVRKVVLSYGLWQRLFAGERNALNRLIQLGGESYTVIGIMPPGFAYPDRTQARTPLMAMYSANADPWWKLRDIRINAVVGCLKRGVSASDAQLDMNDVMSRLAKEYPATNSGVHARVEGLREAETGQFRGYVILVGCSVLLLLVIGCVNVASLFIARACARQREFVIRGVLGSTVWHIIKQLSSESLLYGMLGGVFGTLLALLGIRGLTGLLPMQLPGWLVLHLDWRVLAFTAVSSIGTALIFGLAPLIGSISPDLNEALKHGGRGSSSGNIATTHLRRGLIVAEVALSLLLLVGAGLMLRSFQKLMSVDSGVKTTHLIVASVAMDIPNLSQAEQVQAYFKGVPASHPETGCAARCNYRQCR